MMALVLWPISAVAFFAFVYWAVPWIIGAVGSWREREYLSAIGGIHHKIPPPYPCPPARESKGSYVPPRNILPPPPPPPRSISGNPRHEAICRAAFDLGVAMGAARASTGV